MKMNFKNNHINSQLFFDKSLDKFLKLNKMFRNILILILVSSFFTINIAQFDDVGDTDGDGEGSSKKIKSGLLWYRRRNNLRRCGFNDKASSVGPC